MERRVSSFLSLILYPVSLRMLISSSLRRKLEKFVHYLPLLECSFKSSLQLCLFLFSLERNRTYTLTQFAGNFAENCGSRD